MKSLDCTARLRRWVLTAIAVVAPLVLLNSGRAADPAFWSWAPTPPMGWNSWDGFATTVTEAQTREQADFMAANLKRHGWEYIVVDIQWYEPNATGFDYRNGAKLDMDEWGRLVPAANKFPSAVDGKGRVIQLKDRFRSGWRRATSRKTS